MVFSFSFDVLHVFLIALSKIIGPMAQVLALGLIGELKNLITREKLTGHR